MTTEALLSASITNLDTFPVVFNPSGEGGPGMMRSNSDQVTVTTGKTSGSTYRLARVPVEAKIKHVYIWLDATVTALTADIDLAWSDSTVDGTSVAYQGTIPQIASADNKLYGVAIDLKSVASPTDYVKTPGGAAMNKPAWQNLGYTNNPGGFVDVMLKTTVTNNGAAVVNCIVEYVI